MRVLRGYVSAARSLEQVVVIALKTVYADSVAVCESEDVGAQIGVGVIPHRRRTEVYLIGEIVFGDESADLIRFLFVQSLGYLFVFSVAL